MIDDKYIKIMADYSSTGIWDRDGMMLELDEVPLPFWWVPRFKKWTDKYEDNDDYMENSENDFPYKEFSAEGLELAKSLATILSDWEIWYFDEHEMKNSSSLEDTTNYFKRIFPNGF